MWFMVCRVDAVHGMMKTSELFPCLVNLPEITPPEEIVKFALHEKWPHYSPKNKSYYVVPMVGAEVVSFKPKVDYTIEVEPFAG